MTPSLTNTRNGEPHAPRATLTPRECAVLALIADGLSTKQIAMRLVVTDSMASLHTSHIYQKLHTTNRVQAARWWWEHGGAA